MVGEELQLERLSAAAVQPLRTRLLRPGASSLCVYKVDESHDTRHYGLVDERGAPRAVMTVFPERCRAVAEAPALRFRGLCVDEPLRGRGLGRRLLEGAIARVAVAFPSAEFLWCNARTSATSFYEACGFRQAGEVFDMPGIGPHVVMWKPMPTVLA